MDLKISLTLEAKDEAQLRALLGDKPDLESVLTGHTTAALHEYLEAYLGRRAFTGGKDIREYRLALLIQHALADAVPDETYVSGLFQTTPTASRSLIRNTLAKYNRDLDDAKARSGKAILEKVIWVKPVFHAQGASPNMIEILNTRLSAEDPTQTPIVKTDDGIGTWKITPECYDILATLYGAKKVPQK